MFGVSALLGAHNNVASSPGLTVNLKWLMVTDSVRICFHLQIIYDIQMIQFSLAVKCSDGEYTWVLCKHKDRQCIILQRPQPCAPNKDKLNLKTNCEDSFVLI